MGKNTKPIGKRAKLKRKKTILIAVVVTLALVIVAIGIISIVWGTGVDTYSDGNQTVRLHPNGRFSARLNHDVRYNGAYTRTAQGERTEVALFYEESPVFTEIIEDVFHVPDEWQDNHRHNTLLPKK